MPAQLCLLCLINELAVFMLVGGRTALATLVLLCRLGSCPSNLRYGQEPVRLRMVLSNYRYHAFVLKETAFGVTPGLRDLDAPGIVVATGKI